MALFRRYDSEQLARATSDLSARVQRLETQHVALRARLEGERQLRLLRYMSLPALRRPPLSVRQSSDSLKRCVRLSHLRPADAPADLLARAKHPISVKDRLIVALWRAGLGPNRVRCIRSRVHALCSGRIRAAATAVLLPTAHS